MPQNKVNTPVFVYNDSHQSLNHQYQGIINCKHTNWPFNTWVCAGLMQLEMPQPVLWNSLESDLECTLKTYFDNMILTSQKPCQHNNKCDCSKTNGFK